MKKDLLILNFDGACDNNGNPPMMGVGVTFVLNGVRLHDRDRYFNAGTGTNNVAEYSGLITALEQARDYAKEVKDTRLVEVRIKGDSQLVVNQFTGAWAVKSQHLKPFYELAISMRKGPTLRRCKVSVQWVRRNFNQEADELSKRGVMEIDQLPSEPLLKLLEPYWDTKINI